MDKWRYQFPSTSLTRTHRGNELLAREYTGDANKLLYELKNLMTFRKLGQLKMTRFFQDGTIITAWSIFGQDFINIDVSEVEIIDIEIEKECTITFIDLPSIIQPMRYPGEIGSEEIQNIDYIKTYYSFDIEKCSDCQDIIWDFLFNYSEPFESRHYFNPITNEDEPDNHSIYSLIPPPWGQIITHDRDDGGDYIIWKAYTEYGLSTFDFSRTGLGILLLKASISDGINIICSNQQKIDVDCCKKDSDLRKTLMWWRYCPGTLGGEGPCPVPDDPVPWNILYWFRYGIIDLYAYPEKTGSCIPFEWNLSGPGTLTVSEDIFKLAADFRLATGIGGNCQDGAIITLRDRCETEDTLVIASCCQTANPLSIGYTSLIMSCGGSQILTAGGGCGPYEWALSNGGGTLVNNGDGTATYYAPATNPNCVDNPTITLTDCCGETDDIQLAVNCWTGNQVALRNCMEEDCVHNCQVHPPLGWCHFHAIQGRWDYRCDSVLLDSFFIKYPSEKIPEFNCSLQVNRPWGCGFFGVNPCTNQSANCRQECLGLCNAADICPGKGCGLWDKRTQAMKDGGCCPLNPLTGLPY